MKLSHKVSHILVKKLTLALGAEKAQQVLGVSDARLRYLANGHGCESWKQFEAIESKTGRAGPRWIVDAGARGVKTAEGRAFVARACAMWDEILGPEKKPAKRLAQPRTRKPALQHAV